MKLTLEEALILKELSQAGKSTIKRGPKPIDNAQRQAQRRADRERVADLINRYEADLNKQN